MEKAGVVSDKRKNVQPLSEILYIPKLEFY